MPTSRAEIDAFVASDGPLGAVASADLLSGRDADEVDDSGRLFFVLKLASPPHARVVSVRTAISAALNMLCPPLLAHHR